MDDLLEKLEFDLNDADAITLSDMQEEGLVLSVVGEIKFLTDET